MGFVLTKVIFIGTFFAFLLGSILGSFSKVLADRGLTKHSFWGRSYCPNCKIKLKWYDLFPILSYLVLSGKCRNCKKSIKVEYLQVEIVVGILVGFLFWWEFHIFLSLGGMMLGREFPIFAFDLLFKIFFIVILVPIFITDLKTMLIPDRIILPSIVIGFVLGLLITLYKVIYLYNFLGSSSIGKYLLPPYSDYFQRHAFEILLPFLLAVLMAILIGGFFLSLIIITRGKGMGGGDVKLGAFIGLMLGFPQSLVAIIASFILGAVFSIFLIIAGKKSFGQAIPFGPFLVLGSLISLFFGNQIIDWYLHIRI